MRIRDFLMVGGHNFVTPSRVASRHLDYSSSSTWAVSLPSTPSSGNLMVIVLGGIQSRTVTFPVGWTQVTMQTLNGANTHVFAWKVAGGSEANFNITLNANLQGGLDYYEIEGVDATGTFYTIDISANQSGGPFTTATSNTFQITRPAFVISATLWDDTKTMTVNNSFVAVANTGRAFSAYRPYASKITGQSTTWTKSSGADATATKVNIIQIFGKRL